MTLSKLGVKVFSIFVFLASFATASEARKIHMAVATFSQSVLPMVVAQEKGYFREEDLDVELILTTASVANMALLGGNVDLSRAAPASLAPLPEVLHPNLFSFVLTGPCTGCMRNRK